MRVFGFSQFTQSLGAVASAPLRTTLAPKTPFTSLITLHKAPEATNRRAPLTVKAVAEPQQRQQPSILSEVVQVSSTSADDEDALRNKRRDKRLQKVQAAATYQLAAIAATSGIVSIALCASFYRFAIHLHHGEPFPTVELVATLALVCGGIVGMEMYARYAHRYWWHGDGLLKDLHKSHHEPRTGPFETNDIFAVMNAVPAMALCLYGFLRPDVIGGMCFGAGLGISLFGISYMFVHDGLVHKRFPVGPIADLPALKRIEVAHRIHHMDTYGGVPFGLFLGPQELKAVGGEAELDRLVALQMEEIERNESAAASEGGK